MIKLFIHTLVMFSVFISSTGLWINNHYCQGEFVKTSFINLGSCCNEAEFDLCAPNNRACNQEQHQEDKGCCENRPILKKLNQNQLVDEIKLKSDKDFNVINVIIPLANNEYLFLDKQSVQNFSYLPPILLFDRQVKYQTFLC